MGHKTGSKQRKFAITHKIGDSECWLYGFYSEG